MSARKIKFIIDSDLTLIPLVGSAINKICLLTSLSQIECDQIELCAVEAITNSIKHAYGLKKGNDVEVEMSLYDDKITIKVYDEGVVMDKDLFEKIKRDSMKSYASDIQSIPESGRGIAIITEIMDELTYETKGKKGILTMTKIFSPKEKKSEDD